jgi:hypothetical protein
MERALTLTPTESTHELYLKLRNKKSIQVKAYSALSKYYNEILVFLFSIF